MDEIVAYRGCQTSYCQILKRLTGGKCFNNPGRLPSRACPCLGGVCWIPILHLPPRSRALGLWLASYLSRLWKEFTQAHPMLFNHVLDAFLECVAFFFSAFFLFSLKLLEACIQEHREKIARERQRSTPDLGLIRHRERKIETFQAGIQSAQKRLGGGNEHAQETT